MEKTNRDKAVEILNKFDTSYYIKNDKREAMIRSITELVDTSIAKREKRIAELEETLNELKDENLWEFLKRRYF